MSAGGHETQALVARPASSLAVTGEWSIEDIVAQKKKIQQCMSAVMKEGEHYGVIPGTGGRKDADGNDVKPKPTLLKPGAETLCFMFRFKPEYTIDNAVQTERLISYRIKCLLKHIPTGLEIAEGLGSCNSREQKYLRPAPKKCPSCGRETIIKGKEQYGGGWLCWRKKGGCDAKFADGDASIEQQDTGVMDPADLDNTILKMACKRAHIAAVLGGTAASDFFTQDLEDLTMAAAEYMPPPPAEATPNIQRSTDGQRADDADYNRARMDSEMAAESRISPPPSPAEIDVEVIDGKTGEVTRQPRASAEQVADIEKLARQGGWSTAELNNRLEQRYKCKGGPRNLGRGQAIECIRNLGRKVDAARASMGAIKEFADDDAALIAAAAKLSWTQNDIGVWCVDMFEVPSVQQMTKDQKATALSLLLARANGEVAYRKVFEKAVAEKKIKPLK
jgi:hypothetical protein